MKRTEQELDAELAQMAEEAPPMPADFHERWMNAVREDAKNKPVTDEKPGKGQISPVKLTRILSIAAVFLFLIGGTVLHRNSKRSLNAAFRTEEETDAAVASGAVPDTAADDVPALMMNTAVSADMDMYEAAPKAASESMAALSAKGADIIYEAAEEEAAAEADEEADGAMDMEIQEPVPVPTAMPTPEGTALPAENGPGPEEPAEEQEAGFLQSAGAFLTDMGDFLLTALPYLAVLAVPAVAALVIRRRKNKKN